MCYIRLRYIYMCYYLNVCRCKYRVSGAYFSVFILFSSFVGYLFQVWECCELDFFFIFWQNSLMFFYILLCNIILRTNRNNCQIADCCNKWMKCLFLRERVNFIRGLKCNHFLFCYIALKFFKKIDLTMKKSRFLNFLWKTFHWLWKNLCIVWKNHDFCIVF